MMLGSLGAASPVVATPVPPDTGFYGFMDTLPKTPIPKPLCGFVGPIGLVAGVVMMMSGPKYSGFGFASVLLALWPSTCPKVSL